MWGGGPVGKNTVVFKNWNSLEKNTERKKERGGGERGVDGETQREKRRRRGGDGRLLEQIGVRSSQKLKMSSV